MSDHEVQDEVGDVDEALETFWRRAVFRAKLNHVPSYFGPTPLEVVRPPAWSFGTTDEEAARFVRDLLAGRTTAIAGSERDYLADGGTLPETGELGIVVDGAGTPAALVVVTEVLTVPYAEVDAATTVVEGSGFATDTAMVVQRLDVLYST
ncbi:ASCH domain-containing protein [Nocardioides sp. GXQ0305]|uniref:ASCH domain-containing protein n=1 Tax=Nocardioides sp. GXQ0305 TaxID=3423912 RepID=UPI003D7DCDD3